MLDSDSLKPSEPGGRKYVPPKAVRVRETQPGRPALSLRFDGPGGGYDLRVTERQRAPVVAAIAPSAVPIMIE